MTNMNIAERMRRVRLFAMDVDGVLTDGAIILVPDGDGVGEVKAFYAQDGLAIMAAQRVGLPCAIITSRQSATVEARARELDLAHLIQGRWDKRTALEELVGEIGRCGDRPLRTDEVAFMGDDLNDLGALQAAGLAMAPANACREVLQAAHWIASAPGGRGAVREALEAILKAQGKWAEVVGAYGIRPGMRDQG